MAVIVGKVDGTPMNTVGDAVEKVGGIEEEFFFEGTAARFALAGGAAEYPTNGRWDVEQTDAQPFRTRMLVVRPGNPADFNGTVIVEWNNVSAGENFLGGRGAGQLLEDGFAIVGVSAQVAGVEGMPDHPLAALGQPFPALKTNDPARYETLHHPGDDYSYDIYTQAGLLLATDRPREVDPLGGLQVRHVLASGGSQSAARPRRTSTGSSRWRRCTTRSCCSCSRTRPAR